MIKTKYLVLVIFGCIVLIVSFGVWQLGTRMHTQKRLSTNDVLFSATQDDAHVVPYTRDDQQKERDAFITKVRSQLENTIVEEKTTTDSTAHPGETEPSPSLSSQDSNTTTPEIITTPTTTIEYREAGDVFQSL